MQHPEKESLEIRHRVGGRREGAGRPLGSPNRLTRPLKELASQYGPDALKTLVEIMTGGENEQARIAAAKELLDRGFGRPRPEVDPKHEKITVYVYGRPISAPGDRVGQRALSPVFDVLPIMPDHSAEEAETVEES